MLQPADNSLPAIAHVLNQIGDVMKGGIKPGKSIVKGSVRYAAALVLHTQKVLPFVVLVVGAAPEAFRSVLWGSAQGQHHAEVYVLLTW